jgi:hypothetical protein
VPVESGRPPAQEERGAAGHVGHAAVEALGATGDVVHRAGLELERVHPVLADLGVDDDDGDRGVAVLAQVPRSPAVRGEVARDAVAEGEVVRNRLDRSMMPPE